MDGGIDGYSIMELKNMAESADPYKGLGKLPNLFKPIDGNRIVRAVPLVYYEGIERHVVGTAVLREDGAFTAQVYPSDRNRIKQLLEETSLSQMSFSFDSTDDPNDEKEE